jgi:serine/threonine protein kinase
MLRAGHTLIEKMARSGGRLREEMCARDVVVPLLRALTALHRLGLVHRQLQPEHIMCAPGGGVRLVDFSQSAQLSLRCLNNRVGQLAYMAPEVLNKPSADEIFHHVS